MSERWASSLEGYSVSSEGRMRNPAGRPVKPFSSGRTGYLQIEIRGKKHSVHRLVATAFCDGKTDVLVVNHKNGVRTDNRAENLEWVTMSENTKHAYAVLGRIPVCTGKYSGRHPTSKGVVSIDIATGTETHYQSAMDAVRLGFDSASISRCCNGENRSHKGRRWRFANDADVGAAHAKEAA